MRFGDFEGRRLLVRHPMLDYVTTWEAEGKGQRAMIVAMTEVAPHAQAALDAELFRDADAALRSRDAGLAPVARGKAFARWGREVAYVVWPLWPARAVTLGGLYLAERGALPTLAELLAPVKSAPSLVEQWETRSRSLGAKRALLPASAAVHLGAELGAQLARTPACDDRCPLDFNLGSIALGLAGEVLVAPPLHNVRRYAETSWDLDVLRFSVGSEARGRGETFLCTTVCSIVREWLAAPTAQTPYRDATAAEALVLEAFVALEREAKTLAALSEGLRVLAHEHQGREALAALARKAWDRAPDEHRW